MREEAGRSIWGHLIVILVLLGGFYSLVIYPYILDDLVKGAIIGFMGSSLTWEFGTAIQAATARQAASATAASAATLPTTTVTVPPATVTSTPGVPVEEDIP